MGNLESKRDWGYSLDYMVGMHKILQQPTPSDFVLGTGISHSVRQLLHEAVKSARSIRSLKRVLIQNDVLMRPEDIKESRANPAKAHKLLDWRTETSFEMLISMMMDYDLRLCAGNAGDMVIKAAGVEIVYPGGSKLRAV